MASSSCNGLKMVTVLLVALFAGQLLIAEPVAAQCSDPNSPNCPGCVGMCGKNCAVEVPGLGEALCTEGCVLFCSNGCAGICGTNCLIKSSLGNVGCQRLCQAFCPTRGWSWRKVAACIITYVPCHIHRATCCMHLYFLLFSICFHMCSYSKLPTALWFFSYHYKHLSSCLIPHSYVWGGCVYVVVV